MKKQVMEDERILLERRKIQSKGFAYVIYALLISVLVQQFLMSAPFEQYAVEFIILMACGFYNLIANYRKGIDLWASENNNNIKNPLLQSLSVGLGAGIGLYFIASLRDIPQLIIICLSIVISYFVFSSVVIRLNKNRQSKINQELDEEEVED